MIRITRKELQRRFTEYNEMYFENKLPMCKFGLVHDYNSYGCGLFYMYDGKEPIIRIRSERELIWTDDSLKRVMLHEMLHYYIALKYGMFWDISHYLPPFAYEKWKFNRKYGNLISFYDKIPKRQTRKKKDVAIVKKTSRLEFSNEICTIYKRAVETL